MRKRALVRGGASERTAHRLQTLIKLREFVACFSSDYLRIFGAPHYK